MAVGSFLASILAVVLLIAVGYLVKRAGLLAVEDRRVVNDIIVYLTMPALIFRAVVHAKVDASFVKIPVLALVVMVITMGIAFVIGRMFNLNRKTFGSLLLVSAIGNTGYLGYPLTISLFGQSNLVRAVFFDLFGSVLFVFTIGLLVADRYGEGNEKLNVARELLTFPPLIGLLAAFALRGIGLPLFFVKSVDFLADATIPLIMLSIGLSMELGHLYEHRRMLGLASALKLVIAPLIAFGVGKLFGFSKIDLGISVLEASMPSMMFSLVIGLKYGLDLEFLPAAIVGTTLFSIATIPLLQYLMRLF